MRGSTSLARCCKRIGSGKALDEAFGADPLCCGIGVSRLGISTFVLYLALVSSEWLLDSVLPSSLPLFERQIFAFTLAFVGVCMARPWGRLSWSGPNGRVVGSGLLLFGVPSVLSALDMHAVPAFTRIALLTLIPTVIVMISAASSFGRGGFLSRLGVSTAGLAGAFLLFPADPEALMEKPLSALLLACTVVSISFGSYLGYRALREVRFQSAFVLMLGPSLAVMIAAAMLLHRSPARPGWDDAPAALWGAVELCLLVCLVRVFRPVALATRYLLVPVLTTLEGLLVVRPQIGWRLLLGAGLLLAASARLLVVSEDREADSPMSLF